MAEWLFLLEFYIEIVTLSNMELQDMISDHDKQLIKRNSMIITNPKSVPNTTEIQINANYENALQIVKSNVSFAIIVLKLRKFLRICEGKNWKH